MSRTSEARFWQAVGALVTFVGVCVIVWAFSKYGVASIEPRALMQGLAASFAMLAGMVMFLSGRALHIEESAFSAFESKLWISLAIAALISGAVVVGYTFTLHAILILDRLAMGAAGSFAMMLGVVCLVGQRVMSHMHDSAVPQGQSKTAAASV